MISSRSQWSTTRVRPTLSVVILAGASIFIAFFVHFRPWEEGMLEDWALAWRWEQSGWATYPMLVTESMGGRPLNLLPLLVGLSLSDGGFTGLFAMLGLVAVAQLLVVVWAFRAFGRSGVIPWLMGLLLAIHPWWPAGEIVRFLSAQTSVLCAITALAAFAWFLRSGWWPWLAVGIVSTAVGLLTYPALVLAQLAVTGTVLVVVRATPLRRRIAVCIASAAAVALPSFYIFGLARAVPSMYESQLLAGMSDPPTIVSTLATTVLTESPILLATMTIVLAAAIALLATRSVRRADGWLLVGLAVLSPVTGLTYAATTVHLSDPERVAIPVGFACWAVLALTIGVHRRRALVPVAWGALATALAACTVAVTSTLTWSTYSTIQHAAMRVLAPVLTGTDASDWFVVVDRTGVLGDVYTLYPSFLEVASQLEYDHSAHVTLCTPADVPRLHPVAASYPIPTTPGCDELLAGVHELVLSEPFETGSLDVYRVDPQG